MELKTGDIIMVNTNHKKKYRRFLANAIKFIQGNEWSHAGIIVVEDGIVYVSEAERHGVGYETLDFYVSNGHKIKIKRLCGNISDADRIIIKHICNEWSNDVRYGFINLFFFQSTKLIFKKLFNKDIWVGEKNLDKAKERMTCGKWVAFVYDTIFGIFPEWNKFAPVDLDSHDLLEDVSVKIPKKLITYRDLMKKR